MLKQRDNKEGDTMNLITPKELKFENYGSLDNEYDDEDDAEDEASVELQQINNEHKVTTSSVKEEEKTNFFHDGKTRVDFVLVWEEELPKQYEKPRAETTRSNSKKACESKFTKQEEQIVKWRKKFVKNLKKSGLVMETFKRQSEISVTHYILLNAPWEVLCYHAENLCLRIPLQLSENCSSNWSQELLSKLNIYNIMYQDVPNTPPEYYTCQFRLSKLERYLNKNNQEDFFSNTQRHEIVYQILEKTVYGVQRKSQTGIENLLSEQVFSAAFPLHDGPYKSPTRDLCPENLSNRQILYKYWACWSKWCKYQPLDHIRKYFGEKIAFYFAWIGFYTGWLLPAAVVGTLVLVAGFFMLIDDIPSKEICEEGSNYTMCPLCKFCTSWKLSSICTTFKLGQLFDNGATVFFSIFMSLWAVMFLEYWKRKSAVLAYKWECFNFEEIEEQPRPEFTVLAPMTVKNPITGADEPYFPKGNQLRRIFTSSMLILLLIIVVLIFLVSIIVYRTIISILMYKSGNTIIMATASRIASITGSIINLLVILLLARVYTHLAHYLTKWEMHRTQSKYEDAFVFKVFVFQFVNFYSSPIYIAFFKGRFVGYPGNYKTLFGIRNESLLPVLLSSSSILCVLLGFPVSADFLWFDKCGAGGCVIELAQELLIIMVGKQFINNIQEFVIPKLKHWWQKQKLKVVVNNEANPVLQPWERDYELLDCEGLFDEYLEMVLQFGFITIFVAACPLAPLFALLNNWIEIRLDANKFVCEYRRPVGKKAQGIGIWFHILEVITRLAVISNAFLIAFTSDFLPRLFYRYTYQTDLTGYINFTLAYSPPKFILQNHTMCRYTEFRDTNGHLTLIYWNLMAIRFGFVIVFEHVVFFIAQMIDLLVPDVPESVEIKMKREQYMAKQALADNQTLVKHIGGPAGFCKPSPQESGIASNLQDLPPIPEDKQL